MTTLGEAASWAQIGMCFALIPAAAFALWQWYRACKVTRVEHLRQILMDIKDKDIAKTFYECIERTGTNGKPVVFYNGGLIIAPGYEGRIDKMLMYFSLVCHEHELRVVDESEFSYFAYQIHRTLGNEQVKKYLYDLSSHVLDREKEPFMFKDLIREGMCVERDYYGPLYNRINGKASVVRLFEKVKEVLLWRD